MLTVSLCPEPLETLRMAGLPASMLMDVEAVKESVLSLAFIVFAPANCVVKPLKVAIPSTAWTVVVPASEPLLSEMDTALLALVTTLLLLSSMATSKLDNAWPAVAVLLLDGALIKTSLFAVPGVLVNWNVVERPFETALTVKPPAVVSAVAEMVARPLALVVAGLVPSVTEAPLAGALKVTLAPLMGLP